MARAIAALTKVSARPTRTASGTAKKAREKIEKALARWLINCVFAAICAWASSRALAPAGSSQPRSAAPRSSDVVSQRSFR